ncbi:60S ribosomal protein L22 [Neolecta irregularis DAH-3]|uniref:60S ribosomal protein L22 n=1 Tax=Neolecta irregularis (strain DAH-3) TaxID=1198029 RepID=A0A1U7LN81_NEOID|nr:60S ribosomal protein L22 [Neolecta irregularis DAH-3]|eukprot:OLL24126.1 60S ribosomal protein L22 [Neolecta irregularis DAH-3]
MPAVLKSKQSKQSTKKISNKYIIDASGPARDKLFDVATFEKFLNDRIKVENKTGNLSDKVVISREGEGKIAVVTNIAFSGRYLKYLTKKYLKKHQLRDWLRVVATSKGVYELKYFNVDLDDESEEEE